MKKLFLVMACALAVLAGCKKEDPKPDSGENQEPTTMTGYAYLLNEGSWGSNNAEISRINLATGTIEADWFSSANGRGLGDVAQDLVHYGSRLYCTVWNSNTLEIVDPVTGQSVKQISMGARGPRSIACHEGKVYVSCYDKTVVRIDTATLEIEATCPLSSMQPEQLCVANGKLFVCSTWQYNSASEAVYDSVLCVVDLASFTEVGRIVVGTNPTRVCTLDDHRLLVTISENNRTPHSAIVDLADGNRVSNLDIVTTGSALYDGSIYHYATAYDAEWNPTATFYRTEINTLSPTPILQSHERNLTNAYGIAVHPTTGHIFVCNSPYTSTGDVYCFTNAGEQCWSCEAGMFPSKVVF